MPAPRIPPDSRAAEPIASPVLLSCTHSTRIGPAPFSSVSSLAFRNFMETLIKNRAACGARGLPQALLAVTLLTVTMMLSACGGGSSSSVPQLPLTLTGNWQFTMAPPADGSFLGGLQGG